jgi:serine protease SohB
VKRKNLPPAVEKELTPGQKACAYLVGGIAGTYGFKYFHDKEQPTPSAFGKVEITHLEQKLHNLNCGVASGSGDKSLLRPYANQRSESEKKWVDIDPAPASQGKEVPPPKLWVITFTGDNDASQVESLRDEVTAVIQNSKPEKGDHVLVRLHSGGGTVQGYGLAASQLERVKAAGLHLTVCIDEVAASGGYLMASKADVIVAAPLSQIGSIGVVQSNENYHELFKRLGIRCDEITAGESKRTLSRGKKITEADLMETKKALEETHQIFKDIVASHRPHLNIDQVATGKVWSGTDALRLGLIDEIGVSDDILLGFFHGTRVTPTIITVATMKIEEKMLQKQVMSLSPDVECLVDGGLPRESPGVSSKAQERVGLAECTLKPPNEPCKKEDQYALEQQLPPKDESSTNPSHKIGSTKSKVMFISCPKGQKVESKSSTFTLPAGLAKLAVKEVLIPLMYEEVSRVVTSSGATMSIAGDSTSTRRL